MLFSRGTPLWTELNTFFVNVDLLLLYLKRRGFTGYVKFESRAERYLILLDEGDVVAGVEKNISSGKSFAKPVNEIIAFARENEQIKLTVSKLLTTTVEVFSNLYSENCKLIRKNLHSDFAKMGKLFAQMQQDRFNGYILVDFIKEERHGIIMLNTGKIGAVVTDKIQLGIEDSDSAKVKSSTMLFSEAQNKGAIFNIYQLF